jgi:hypothetical protein
VYDLLTPSDSSDGLDKHWHQRVLEDHLWMQEYGCPFDLRELPAPEFKAHLALIQGEQMREIDESEKQEREVDNI